MAADPEKTYKSFIILEPERGHILITHQHVVRWRRKWQPLQYSCLENSMYRGARKATVHGVTKGRTQQSDGVQVVRILS